MKFKKLPMSVKTSQHQARPAFGTRTSRDPYGNEELYVCLGPFGFLINFENVCLTDENWWFLGVFDRDDMGSVEINDPVAIYCKGWDKQVWLTPTHEELHSTWRLLRSHAYLPDDHPRMSDVVVRSTGIV